MDDSGPTASIIMFFVLLIIDMLFYGFGSAIQFLNSKEVEKRILEDNDKRSLKLQQYIFNPSQYINTVQLVVTLITITMGSYYFNVWFKNLKQFFVAQSKSNLQFLAVLNQETIGVISMIVAIAGLSYLILTFGVLIPKRIASKNPEKLAYLLINPIYYVTQILSPFTGLITISANGILSIFGISGSHDVADVTEAEIISMVNEGQEQGVLQASEAEMITNIFEYGDKEAQDIMTRRINIVGIDSNLPLKQAITYMLAERNSRYPVYEDNIDHIIGILYLKDALRVHASDETLNTPIKEVEGLVRSAEFIPETRNIDSLFKTMQSMKIHMVIVVDEYGQTSGLVTLEDILEEIVGNILDEYDEDEDYIEEKGNNEYLIEGMTPLEDLEELLEIDFDEEEFDTLNGFLISKMDKIPEENEEFNVDVCGYNFKVMSVENKMIQSVLVTKQNQDMLEEIVEENETK